MARPLRIEYSGAFYHVMNRGNAGEKIFAGKRDREKFLEYVEKAVERFSLVVHSYCLMDNHYHLLIETPESNLSSAVQWLNVSYAVYFNRKWQRRGHLFGGRFKAILIDADEYLKQLSRYIHLNPVRAKVTKRPGDYAWSSYNAFLAKDKAPEWLEVKWLLAQFGRKKKEAAHRYKDYVEKIDAFNLKNPETDLVEGAILGDTDFVSWVKEQFLSSKEVNQDIPQLRRLKPKPSLNAIVAAVCNELGCEEEQIIEKGRHKNIAREMAVYMARDLSGKSCKDLGGYFGGISSPAITLCCNQFGRRLENDMKLKRRTARIKKRLLNI
jgi:REP element-mobilizing transposase RayT